MRAAVRSTGLLGLFIEFLEHSPILCSPLNEPIRTTTFNHGCRGARTGKLDVPREEIEAVLLDEGAVGDQLVAKSDDVRPLLCGLSLLQDSRRTLKHHEAIWCSMAASFRTFHATEEGSARLLLRRWLGDRDEQIGSEDRQ